MNKLWSELTIEEKGEVAIKQRKVVGVFLKNLISKYPKISLAVHNYNFDCNEDDLAYWQAPDDFWIMGDICYLDIEEIVDSSPKAPWYYPFVKILFDDEMDEDFEDMAAGESLSWFWPREKRIDNIIVEKCQCCDNGKIMKYYNKGMVK